MVSQPLDGLWILWLAVLLLAAWGLNEFLRRRRLKRFVLPGSRFAAFAWGLKLGGAALRAAGTCAAAAVLVVPFAMGPPAQEADPRIVMALDTSTLGGASGAPWSVGIDVERTVSRVLGASTGCRWTVFALGDPPHRLVPETPDAQGTLMMLGEAVLERPEAAGALTRQSLADLAGRLSSGEGHTTLFVLTADTTDNIMRIPPPATTARLDLVMVQLSPGSPGIRLAAPRPPAWHWEGGAEALPALLNRARAAAHSREEEWGRRNAPVRYLAGLALLLLGAESVRGLIARPQNDRGVSCR